MISFRLVVAVGLSLGCAVSGVAQEIVGTHVIPHQFSPEMQWSKPPNPELSAKVELFVKNTQTEGIEWTSTHPPRFDGLTAKQLLEAGHWAWHDTPEARLDPSVNSPPDSLTVLSINGKSAAWGVGTRHELQLGDAAGHTFPIEAADCWLSSVTFLSAETPTHAADSILPNEMVVHIVNAGATDVQLHSVRLWLPKPGESHHVFYPIREFARDDLRCFPANGIVATKARGGFTVTGESLPLTYAVVEVRIQRGTQTTIDSLWAHLRIKREVFDISGGWVASNVHGRGSLSIDEYLLTLKRMHINAGQIQEVGGFTDDPQRYASLPLKRFNRLWPLAQYDTDAMLPTIHAVEFLGEPQYGGGRPVPPQEVWEQLAPYQSSRLPTSLTLSEEHSWRYYAGLSDYPHYDAYRVIAPAADSWRSYDRWGGQRIRWGAPLETIGTMTRSLRHHSRPRPIAYWSQGPHDGWGSRWIPRRGSPTPDELRSQAWHGLANRITSLYWFNLSLPSLAKFPDLIEPITRVNREIRMLEDVFLSGDAFEYRRVAAEGEPSWDINSIATPNAILLVAHDLAYDADSMKREFVFAQRPAVLEFQRPAWLSGPLHVFQVDADGTHSVAHTLTENQIRINGSIHVVGVYLATTDAELRARVDRRHAELLEYENAIPFDPVHNQTDLAKLLQYRSD